MKGQNKGPERKAPPIPYSQNLVPKGVEIIARFVKEVDQSGRNTIEREFLKDFPKQEKEESQQKEEKKQKEKSEQKTKKEKKEDKTENSKKAKNLGEKIDEIKDTLKTALKVKLYSKEHHKALNAPSSRRCTISKDATTLISGGEEGVVQVFTRKGEGVENHFDEGETLSIMDTWGMESEITSVCLTENKDVIFACQMNTKITFWKKNGKNWSEPQEFIAHSDWVRSLAITPDGKTLFSASDDKTIKVWRSKGEYRGYEEIQSLKKHEDWVMSVSVTSDASTLFSGDKTGKIMVWSKNEGSSRDQYDLNPQELTGHSEQIQSLANTPDGGIMISGSNDLSIRVWIKKIVENKAKYSLLQVLKGHSWIVWSVSISDDGNKIFSGAGDYTGILWMRTPVSESPYYTHNQTIRGNNDMVRDSTMSGSGDTLVLCGVNDDDLIIFERKYENEGIADSEKVLGEPQDFNKKHSSNVLTLAATQYGSYFFSGSNDNSIIVWRKTEEGIYFLTQKLEEHSDCVNRVCITPDGSTLFSASDDKTVRVYAKKDPKEEEKGEKKEEKKGEKTYKELQSLDDHNAMVNGLAVTKDGTFFFSSGQDNTIIVWMKGKDGKYILYEKLEGHTNCIWDLAVTPDGETLVSVSGDSTVRIWRKGPSKDEKNDLKDKEESFSKKEKLYETEEGQNKNYKEELPSKNPKKVKKILKDISYHSHQVLEGHSKTVFSVALSKNGKTIVSGSQDTTIRVWLMKREDKSFRFVHHQTLEGHSGDIVSICLSDDGMTIF